MSLGPLVQSPALHDLLRFVELEVFARDVASEQLELASLLGTLERLGSRTGKGRDPLWVSEGLVQLFGGSAELFGVIHRGRVDQGTALARLGGGMFYGEAGSGRIVEFGGAGAANGVRISSVLDVFAVLRDQGWSKGCEEFSELRDDLGANKVLYGLLAVRI